MTEIVRVGDSKGIRADLLNEFTNQPVLVNFDYGRVLANAVIARIDKEGALLERVELDLEPNAEARERTPYRGEKRWFVDDRYPEIAVVPIFGTLNHIIGGMASLGRTYGAVQNDLLDAMDAPGIRGIALLMNGPGGSVPGVTATADLVADIAGEMPVWAMVNEQMCSGLQWIGAAAQRTYLTRVGCMGSIGVAITRMDVTALLEQRGVKPHFFTSGDLKLVGNPEQPMEDKEREFIEGRIQSIKDQFIGFVSEQSGISYEAIDNLQGKPIYGEEAVEFGLAYDIVQSEAHFMELFSKHLNTNSTGGSLMDRKISQEDHEAGITSAENALRVALSTEHQTAVTDLQKKITDLQNDKDTAVKAASDRIIEVLSSEEYEGREAITLEFLKQPEMASVPAAAIITMISKVDRKVEAPEGAEDSKDMTKVLASAEAHENGGKSTTTRGDGGGTDGGDGTGANTTPPSGAAAGQPDKGGSVKSFMSQAGGSAKAMAEQRRNSRRG